MIDRRDNHTTLLHVVDNLIRDLSEYLLRQVSLPDCVVELYELHNVAFADFARRCPQFLLICIQLVHHAEISLAHTYDDHRAGEFRHFYE